MNDVTHYGNSVATKQQMCDQILQSLQVFPVQFIHESALNSKMASSEEIGIALVAVILNELHKEDNQRKMRRACKRHFWI